MADCAHDIITAHELSRNFGSLTAVDSLSLQVPAGELFGLIGSDGAGKTTTLRMLAGILDPSGGELSVLGHPYPSQVEMVHAQIGYMSQRFGLYPDLTVGENLAFYADIFGVTGRERRERTGQLLGFSGLADFTARQAGRLSGGMKQKLGLCCALIHKPRLLLLDEPTNGVDPVSRRDFWRILRDLHAEGVTIVVATAYLDEAGRCDRVGLIHKGRMLACDTPAALRGLVNGSILEISGISARPALDLLRRGMPEASLSLFGDRLHLQTREPQSASNRVNALLSGAGMGQAQVRTIAPSLEDVFVDMMPSRE